MESWCRCVCLIVINAFDLTISTADEARFELSRPVWFFLNLKDELGFERYSVSGSYFVHSKGYVLDGEIDSTLT